MFKEDHDLRAVDRLRWIETEDGLTEAWVPEEKVRNDRLYVFGPGLIALHYRASQKGRLKTQRAWWLQRIGKVVRERIDEREGLLVFRADGPEDIPVEFFHPKGLQKRGPRLRKERGGPGGDPSGS